MIRNRTLLALFVLPLSWSHLQGADFVEAFDDNRNEWPWIGNDETTESQIKDGKLYWKFNASKKGSYQKTVIDPDFDFSGNYEISVKFQQIETVEGEAAGILWEYEDSDNYHEITIDAQGHIQARTVENDIPRIVMRPTTHESIRPSEMNTVSVRKIDGFFYFYANGNLLAKSTAFKSDGPKIAAKIESNVAAAFDYFHIHSLKKNEEQETLQASQTLAASHPELTQPLVEDFVDNRNGWGGLGENNLHFAEIANGTLYYENLNLEPNTSRYITLSTPLDISRDFNIDVELKYVSGTETQFIGLDWDRGTKHARRQFGLTGNRYYTVRNYDGENWNTITDWTKDLKLVKDTGFNKLSIRKIGKVAYYILNDQPISKETITHSYGHRCGLSIPAGATAEMDSLYVTYPDQSAAAQTLLAQKLDEQIYLHQIANGPVPVDLVEEFDDNSNKWNFLGEHDDHAIRIEDSHLVYTVNSDKEKWTYFEKPLNQSADFEATLRFVKESGPDDYRVTFILGMKDGDNTHYFNIAHDGHYRIDNYVDGADTLEIKWTKTDTIKSTGYNELTIKKVSDQLFYYINGQIIRTLPFEGFIGNRIGVIAPNRSVIKFDRLSLTYQDRSYTESLSAKDALDADLREAYESNVKGAYHAAAASEKKAEEERLAYLAAQLDGKDQKELDKVRRQWNGKAAAILAKKWGQPHAKRGNLEGTHNIYYPYKMKGNTQYYFWFSVVYTGSRFDVNGNKGKTDPRLFKINSVQFTSTIPPHL